MCKSNQENREREVLHGTKTHCSSAGKSNRWKQPRQLSTAVQWDTLTLERCYPWPKEAQNMKNDHTSLYTEQSLHIYRHVYRTEAAHWQGGTRRWGRGAAPARPEGGLVATRVACCGRPSPVSSVNDENYLPKSSKHCNFLFPHLSNPTCL